MDGLDALLAEATSAREEQRQSVERKEAERREAAKRSQQRVDGLAQVAKHAPSPSAGAPSAAVKRMLDRLKSFLTTLLDPSVLDIIARELAQRSFADLQQYCDANPKLVEYTLTRELERMQYGVMTRDGRLSEPTAIRAMHAREPTPAREVRLLLAASNQSLLADFIAAVQPHWMDGELSISVRASRCSFELDLREEHRSLRAQCDLSICTLGVGDTPLEIATAAAAIEVDARQGSLRQRLEKPRLCECVIFEEQLLGVASALSATAAASAAVDLPTPDAVGTAATPQRSGAPGSGAASIDDVAKQLEAFMTADAAEAAGHDASGAETSGGGLLSSLWSWGSSTPTQPQLYRRDDVN